MGGFMSYLEISLHIEQQLVKLLSLSENAKYYALIHHNKFESFIDDFNLTVNQEMKWAMSHQLLLNSNDTLVSYCQLIRRLNDSLLLTLNQGHIIYYINTQQTLIHRQLLKHKQAL